MSILCYSPFAIHRLLFTAYYSLLHCFIASLLHCFLPFIIATSLRPRCRPHAITTCLPRISHNGR
ncbi:hypothetical protein [Xenorhabdus szentirmaii]|uniref:hypothetical protein n=1 Tax=Xenorhabdus szentirmaii TaxID=290112 RepID=UPI001993B36F|nr:hypothetical protein [Xenorhabdus sp. CUL]MBD2790727.1 hypothetical protein [Xenorhabdus sp. CUL]